MPRSLSASFKKTAPRPPLKTLFDKSVLDKFGKTSKERVILFISLSISVFFCFFLNVFVDIFAIYIPTSKKLAGCGLAVSVGVREESVMVNGTSSQRFINYIVLDALPSRPRFPESVDYHVNVVLLLCELFSHTLVVVVVATSLDFTDSHDIPQSRPNLLSNTGDPDSARYGRVVNTYRPVSFVSRRGRGRDLYD